MKGNDLSRREQELLRLVINWRSEFGPYAPVERRWLRNQMRLENNSISSLKRRLIDKGYLRDSRVDFIPSEFSNNLVAATNTMSNRQLLRPIQLPIVGEVRAGRARQDELRVEITDLNDDNLRFITIPNMTIDKGLSVFLLQVVGESMERERIYEGDYVIVQTYPMGQAPKQGDLIVTRYLAPKDEQEYAEFDDVMNDILEGPTLKFFTENAEEERPYRLSWRRDTAGSPYTIKTKVVRPIGKVIGIYRDVARSS